MHPSPDRLTRDYNYFHVSVSFSLSLASFQTIFFSFPGEHDSGPPWRCCRFRWSHLYNSDPSDLPRLPRPFWIRPGFVLFACDPMRWWNLFAWFLIADVHGTIAVGTELMWNWTRFPTTNDKNADCFCVFAARRSWVNISTFAPNWIVANARLQWSFQRPSRYVYCSSSRFVVAGRDT